MLKLNKGNGNSDSTPLSLRWREGERWAREPPGQGRSDYEGVQSTPLLSTLSQDKSHHHSRWWLAFDFGAYILRSVNL